jgi:hypothetical protein
MQSWAQDYWRDVAQARGDEGQPFGHTASDQLGPRGLEAGDRLYVVGSDNGELLLIGRMDVAHVVRTPEAKRLMGTSNLFPRSWHAIGRAPLRPLSFERRVPEAMARSIRSEGGKPLKIDAARYRLSNMALVTARFLAPESAAALDTLIDDKVADSEEVRGVEARARGRGRRRASAEQNSAVENHAVATAITHFETQGWEVEDVGLLRSYDLHCTRGRRTLHVEVKGTTGPLSTIALTNGEVKLANERYPNTALFVVCEIKLDGTPRKPRPRGGGVHLEQPWRPIRSRLRAVAYSYRLD